MNSKLFDSRVSRLRDATVLAIFRTRAPEHAVEGIGAAVRGGFEAVEITMNSPGATEIFAARSAGADWVKVFPAENLGGPEYVANVLGPLDGTPILVTGGLTPENYLGYLDAGAELVGFANA